MIAEQPDREAYHDQNASDQSEQPFKAEIHSQPIGRALGIPLRESRPDSDVTIGFVVRPCPSRRPDDAAPLAGSSNLSLPSASLSPLRRRPRNPAGFHRVLRWRQRKETTVPDPRYPRGRARADNAGFSIVLALGGFLALGLMALAISDDAASERAADALTAQRAK